MIHADLTFAFARTARIAVATTAIALTTVACSPEPGDQLGSPTNGSHSTTKATPSIAAIAPGPAVAAAARSSIYTSLVDCRVVQSSEDDGGYSISTCAGPAGYTLRVEDADAREELSVTRQAGKETALRLTEVGGGGFSRLGDRVEWRGTMAGGAFRPDAIVVRYFVVESEGAAETAYLLPIKLGAGGPCVTARIAPGSEQSAQARATVDGAMRCLVFAE